MRGDVNTPSTASPLRQEQARLTRQRVIEAAHRLLLERGYAGTTITEVARAAGVAVPTVYKVFGTKSALVKRVVDVYIAGDDEPVPLRDRPELQRIMAEPDPYAKVLGYAHLARVLFERLGPLLSVLTAAAGSNDELRTLVAGLDEERLTGTGRIVAHLADAGALRAGLPRREAHDVLWLLTAPDVYTRLVEQRGWTLDELERWLARAMTTALLEPQ